MAVSKAQQRATNKYIAKAYDRINLTVPKGDKETIKAHSEARGESVNGFINRAISETIERDNSALAALQEQVVQPNFKRKVIIYWSEEDEAYIAEMPELSGCMADGPTAAQALKNIEQVAQEWIETAQELGRRMTFEEFKQARG